MGSPGFRPHLAGLRRLRRRVDDDRPRRHPLYAHAGRGRPRIRTAHRGPEVRPAYDAPSRRGRPPRLAGTAVRRGPARAGTAWPPLADSNTEPDHSIAMKLDLTSVPAGFYRACYGHLDAGAAWYRGSGPAPQRAA